MSKNALVPAKGTDVALPIDLMEQAKDYAKASMAANTRAMYQHWWADYNRWCDEQRRQPLPTNTETVIGYITWLATGRGGTRPKMARATIEQALAAIKYAARAAGSPVDAEHPALKAVLKGIRRDIASERTVKKATPLTAADIRDLLQVYNPEIPREARNRALLALGFAGCLRRSEITGLDWGRAGSKKDETRVGFITPDANGLKIVLLTSKNYQDESLEKAIPRSDAPLTCA